MLTVVLQSICTSSNVDTLNACRPQTETTIHHTHAAPISHTAVEEAGLLSGAYP